MTDDCYLHITNQFSSSDRLYSKSYKMFSAEQNEPLSKDEKTGRMDESQLVKTINVAHALSVGIGISGALPNKDILDSLEP